MKIYVAGRIRQTEMVNKIQREAESRGHEVTHDWTGPEGGIKPDWSAHPEDAIVVAGKDRDGVFNADAVIMCGWGCSEEEKGGLGCFIEAGIAIAVGIPVVIIGPMRESVFWYLPGVERYSGTNTPDEEIDWAITKAEAMSNPTRKTRQSHTGDGEEILVLAKHIRSGDKIHMTVMGGEEDFEVLDAIPRADNHKVVLLMQSVGGDHEDEVDACKEIWIKRREDEKLAA